MADKSKDLYRGLLIPDGDLYRVWESETTVDEAGNRAGIPATGSKTETIIEASGHQADTGEGRVLEVLSIRGGYPGPGEAGYAWRQAAEGVQDWRGWDVPAVISSWENVDFNSSANFNLHPDLVNVTRPDGSDYMVTVYEFVSGSNIRVAMRKRTGDTWGAESIIYVESDYVAGRYLHPSILVLPTGRLLVFHWVYDHSKAVAQIRMTYSDDEGATWITGGSFTLPEAIDLTSRTPLRIRTAYKDGQILLLTWIKDTSKTVQDLILQFASDDLGTSFLLVVEMTGDDTDNGGASPDVAVSSGVFVVSWIATTGNRPTVNRLGSAYQPIIPATPFLSIIVDPWASITGSGIDVAELSVAADRDGVVYLYGTQEPDSQGICCVVRSYDGGQNWNAIGQGGAASSNYGRWWGAAPPNSGNTAVQPRDYTVEFHRGRAVVVHRYINNATQEAIGENSLCFFYLGGFGSVVLPGLELFKRDVLRAGFLHTWVPFANPDDCGYTRAVFGVPTTEAVVSPGVLDLVCPAGSSLLYGITPPESATNNGVLFTDGFIGRATLEVKAAPSRSSITARVFTASGGGVFGQLNILIYQDRVDVVDGVTSAVLATTPNAVDQKRQIFWAIRGIVTGDNATGAECAVWIRDWDQNEDRYFNLVYQGALTLAGGGSTSFVRFGDNEAATDSDAHWSEFELTYGKQTSGKQFSFVGLQIAQGQVNPDQLFPRNYSSSPLYVDSDTRVAAIDGPTFEADKWTVTARHLQGTENVFSTVSPSPAKTWRSKTAVAGATIAFQRNVDGEDAWAGNDFYAIHFQNVNFKRAQLQYRIGGAWVNVVNISFYREFDYQRRGHSIRTVSDDAGSFYAYYNEFAGNKIEFNPDPIIGSPVVATVLRNSEGMAYEGTAAKPATLFLDPDTYAPADVPASGTAHLWFKNMTVLIPNTETPIEGIRLQLCQTGTLPPEGYYEAGNIIPGPVALFGWDYSRERNITKTPNVELTTLRDGTRHSYKAGDERRRVRFSWAEGVDVSQIRREYTLPASPDYVTARAGGSPVALRNDSPALMWGLLDRIDGPGIPVVYIPLIEYSQTGGASFDPRQYARGAIYGRTVTPITLETVVGNEEKTEVYRVNTVTIEEEL